MTTFNRLDADNGDPGSVTTGGPHATRTNHDAPRRDARPRAVRAVLCAALLLAMSCWLTLAAATPVAAEPVPAGQRARLLELSDLYHARLDARRPRHYEALRTSLAPATRHLNVHPGVELIYVTERGRPVYFATFNLNAARTISTDDVWPGGSAGLTLDGTAIPAGKLGMWDEGPVRLTHQEFGGRVTQTDTTATFKARHSTQVAGTMVAAGVVASARGMAPAAGLTAYNWNYDLSEMAAAAAAGMRVSNHSYGILTGWWTGYKSPQHEPPYGGPGGGTYWHGDLAVDQTEDYWFGYYNADARDWDQVAHDAPRYTIVKAAGNDRDNTGPAAGQPHYHLQDNGGTYTWVEATDSHEDDGASSNDYDTLPPISTAKNIVSVGAAEDIPGGWSAPGDVVLTSYSGWGPTDDGRIKPDLVANGVDLRTSNNLGDTDYDNLNGTSAAAPTVAGSVALLVDLWESTHAQSAPLSSSVKAILIQTADEHGSDGPGYEAGWGLMNTRRAAELVDADGATPGLVIEEPLENGKTDAYYFYSDGAGPIRVTLAWNDPAGTSPAAIVDPTTAMLVNDLDLRVEEISAGVTHEPWVLDPINPADAAVTGDNTLDNVEQIAIATPSAGHYSVTVTHKGTLAEAQDYSLVAPGRLTCTSHWVDVTAGPLGGGGATMGTAWGDYDRDGDPDLYLSRGTLPNQLLRNDGGVFTDVTTPPLDHSGVGRGAIWGDVDGDADLDLYLCNFSFQSNRLFRNDGGGSFTDITAGPLGGSDKTLQATWVDYDRDADLDLYVVNFESADRLLQNDGTGSFVDVTAAPLGDAGRSYCAAWADYDLDGDPDLYLGKMGNQANGLYRNDGDGNFANVTSGPLGTQNNTASIAWGDHDNDGDFDLYLSSFTGSNQLLRNEGDGLTFVDVSSGPLGMNDMGYGCSFGDVDLDGLLDLFIANTSAYQNYLLLGQGGDTFADVTATPLPMTLYDQAALVTMVDPDLDGDLDLYVGSINTSNRLFENQACRERNWFVVDLEGSQSNVSGIGTRIVIEAGGVTQTRQIEGGAGSASQNPLQAHFGLGLATEVDVLRLYWPSGEVQELTQLAANQYVTVEEPAAPGGCATNDVVQNGSFDTGDLTAWDTNIGSNPGRPVPVITVEDRTPMLNAVHIERALDDDGSHAVIVQGVDPVGPIGDCDEITLSLDVRIDSHNFDRYGSWNVYPANVWVNYEDEAGASHTFRRSFYLTVQSGHSPDPLPQAEQLTAGVWTHREFDLSSLSPPVASITQISAGAQGWSYDISLDNIVLEVAQPTTGIGDGGAEATPIAASRLLGNHPNPFNPATTIRFELRQGGPLTLDIYDVRGALVRRLIRRVADGGMHDVRWDGRDDRGQPASSGVYLARLVAPGLTARHKMMLVK